MQQQDFVQEKVLNYPILQHFNKDNGEIVLNPQGGGQLKPVGKAVFGTVATAGVIGGGYLVWTYILPPVMIMLGQFLALAATGVAAIGLFFLFPTIIKALKRFAKNSEKALIREDPFGELEDQKAKMLAQRLKFKESKAKIKALKTTMQSEAYKSEGDSKDCQDRITSIRNYCLKLRNKRDELLKQHGAGYVDSDEITEIDNELMKKLSEGQRLDYQLAQSKSFVQKYGTRANVMAKLDRNLSKAETAMDIKIQDFDVTIDMLKKDYQFAKNSKDATDAAKSAMQFTKDWQLDYAMEVVTSTISLDLARTSENLLDIDKLTSEYSMDNDEMFNKLDTLANKISGGQDVVPQAKQYSSPNYRLTESDKQSSGGFGNLF
jgi:hypothetical protein